MVWNQETAYLYFQKLIVPLKIKQEGFHKGCIGGIEFYRKKEEDAQNPPKKKVGPFVSIINYIIFMKENGFEVSDEDIIKFMQKRMPKLGTDYVQSLVNKARATRIIAYYKYRNGKTSQVLADVTKEFPNKNRLSIAKAIQKYRINPDCLSKIEKAEVERHLKEIIEREQQGR